MAGRSEREFEEFRKVPEAADLTGMLAVVHERWTAARGDNWAPTWGQFALETLPPRVIPWCVAVNVHGDAEDFTCRFWGTERGRLQGQELTGRSICEFQPASMADVIRDECREIVASRRPMWVRKRHETPAGLELGFESLRVPLSDGAEAVAVILSIARSETLTSENYRYFGTEPPLALTLSED